jgi:hypothetical protein
LGAVYLFKKKFNSIKFQSSTLIFGIVIIITFLLFTRYQGFSFYQVLFKLPGFGSMRSLTRIINI